MSSRACVSIGVSVTFGASERLRGRVPFERMNGADAAVWRAVTRPVRLVAAADFRFGRVVWRSEGCVLCHEVACAMSVIAPPQIGFCLPLRSVLLVQREQRLRSPVAMLGGLLLDPA